jgi:hypothetical protein
MKNDALAAFDNASHGQNETNQSFLMALDAVTRHVFPKRAAQLQKRYMRRVVCKPATMSTKQFAARIRELNAYLPLFPAATPGGPVVTSLEDDEIVDLMEYGIPRSWQRKMIEHDFDSVTSTIPDFVDFCERMESIERAEGGVLANTSPTKISSDHKNRNHKKRGRDSGSHYCMLHGPDKGHNTEDCKRIKAQVDEVRSGWKTVEGKNKKQRGEEYKFQMALLQELNLLDKDGNPKHFGNNPKGSAFSEKLKRAVQKRKPSKQFEEELQNLEALSLSDDSDKSPNHESDSD